MKKHNWMVFGVVLVLGLFVFAAGALALTPEEKEAIVADVKEEIKDEGAGWAQHISIGGLIEFGGVWQDVNMRSGENKDKSDLCLTTLELAVEAEVTEWINVEAILLYEDPTFNDEEGSLDVDGATITIGNTEEFPLYVTGGKMYVPFGALLTSFPDDPLVHAPLTLLMGETGEKALLVGLELGGFSASAYGFNGDMDKAGKNNKVDSYGFDANFQMDFLDLLVGASYISNIADSDGLSEKVEAQEWDLKDYVAGYDVYGHIKLGIFFIDAEYMAALDKFKLVDIGDEDAYEEAKKASVWNVEAGFGEETQIVAKYAGSDKAADLGYPKTRYGLCLNQQIHEGVVASVAYLYDDYYTDDADDRKDSNLFCAQMAVEF